MLAVSLADVGEAAMWAAGSGTALAVIAKAPPTRWLVRRNIAEPFQSWFRHEVGAIVDQKLDARPLTNGKGWAAVKALADKLGVEIPDPHEEGE